MLGIKIKNLRKEKGLTQLELSKQLNMSRSVLSMLEANKQGTSQSNLKKIADFFDVTIDYLLSDSDDKIINKPEKTIDLQEVNLVKEFKKLNSKGKLEAVKRIKELGELSKYQDNEFADELMPIAAHDKEGIFTKEEYKHDMDIMKDDNLWK